MGKTEEILSAKESYDFLKGAQRVLVKVAMVEYHQSQIKSLKRQIESMPSKKIRMQVAWDYPGYEGSKEFISKDVVLNIISNT